MYLDYASPSPPSARLLKLRRTTKWCMVLAAVITGLFAVLPLIGVVMVLVSRDAGAGALVFWMACAGWLLFTATMFWAFQDTVGRRSKADSIGVCAVAALHASLCALMVCLLIVEAVTWWDKAFSGLVPKLILFSVILVNLVYMTTCVALIVLVILCHRANPRDDNPYPRYMRRM